MDLLGYFWEESRDEGYPYPKGALEDEERHAKAVLLGRVHSSLKKYARTPYLGKRERHSLFTPGAESFLILAVLWYGGNGRCFRLAAQKTHHDGRNEHSSSRNAGARDSSYAGDTSCPNAVIKRKNASFTAGVFLLGEVRA